MHASTRDCRTEASFQWCCEPPVCAKNYLVHLAAFAKSVCFSCFQILAVSFSDVHLKTMAQKAVLRALPPTPNSDPAWHPHQSCRFGRFSRPPASSGVPQTCPGPASLLGLSLPKVARSGRQPARPSSRLQSPQAALLGPSQACPLLGFPPLRLSQRRAFQTPKLRPRRSGFRIAFQRQAHTPFKVSQSRSFLETQARPLAGVEGFSSPSPGSPGPTGLAGVEWQEVGAPAALTPVVGALGRCSPQRQAAAALTGAAKSGRN